MALALGKVTILVGAGVLGSVCFKEGRVASDVYGAFKTILTFVGGKSGDSSPPNPKPQNNALLAQFNELKMALQTLEANKSVTVIHTGSSGRGTYVAPIFVVVVVGYGYIWWKGYKLSDLMFATRRGLTDACTNVGKQLDVLSSSIGATKQHLSSRIDRVDCTIDECIDITSDTKEEVALLRGDLSSFHKDVESVHRAVQILGTKICTIEGKQNYTNNAVENLVSYAQKLEKGGTGAFTKALPSTSSRPALEPQPTPIPRTTSLPPLLELPSPSSSSSSSESPKVTRPLRGTISGSGLKDLQMLSDVDNGESVPVTPKVTSPVEAPKTNGSSSTGGYGWNFAGRILGRTSSAKAASKF